MYVVVVAVLEHTSKISTLQSATSFVSSWSVEAGDKEIHLSQSSESNLNAEKRLECNIKDTTKESLCYLCKRKAPALRLVVRQFELKKINKCSLICMFL